MSVAENNSSVDVYALSFSGTGCTRDEGEVSRKDSDRRIYSINSGYIPVRILKEVNGVLSETPNSIGVRGVGQNDWALPRDNSEPLFLNGPLDVPRDLLKYSAKYASGDQCSIVKQASGNDLYSLALHGANKAVASGAKVINMIGHSRGAVSCLIAAWFIYSYGPKDIKINIFAIDPVPGPGNWYSSFTTIAPNVESFAAVYSWDQCNQLSTDSLFTAVVPYPNNKMVGSSNLPQLGSNWYSLGDHVSTPDPLGNSNLPKAKKYDLYLCRGRHSTISGNITTDALYDPIMNYSKVSCVPDLIYLMARKYFSEWKTKFVQPCAVKKSAKRLRSEILNNHGVFDSMGVSIYRTSQLPERPYVRRVSSSTGTLPWDKSYLEDMVGDPPYEQYYPVTNERSGKSWADWYFL